MDGCFSTMRDCEAGVKNEDLNSLILGLSPDPRGGEATAGRERQAAEAN